MITLSPDAQARLESYLAEVKASLSAYGSADADEVVRDLREHIQRELVEEPSPVAVSCLEKVLQRLGAPEQWIPAGQPSAWNQFLLRMSNGPNDWRLAYVSFGMFMLWILVGWIAMPIFVCLLLAAVVFARASLTVEHAEESEGRKWLLYPPLIAFYVPLAIALIGWPLFFGSSVWMELWHYKSPIFTTISLGETDLQSQSAEYPFRSLRPFGTPPDVSVGVLSGVAVSFATGVWWIILGLSLRKRPGWIQILFRPFCKWFTAWHAKIVWIGGTLLITFLGVFLLLFLS